MAVKEFVVGARSQREWGWLVIVDFFLAGAGAGLFLISLVMNSPLGMVAGLVLVLVGGVFLVADLPRPLGAWRVISRPQDSWLSRGTLGILVFAVLAVVHILARVTQPAGWVGNSATWISAPAGERTLAVVAGVAALFLALYPGFLLGSMRSIPLWNRSHVPALFLISSLLSGLGAAFLLPLNWAGQAGALTLLKNISIGLIVLQIILLAVLVLGTHPNLTAGALRQMTHGRLRLPFYLGVLVIGLIIPLAVLLMVSAPSPALLYGTGIPLLLGMFSLRYVVVKAGIYASVA